MLTFIYFLSVSSTIVYSFSISDSRASSGDIITQPAHSGDDAPSIDLSCSLELNPGDHWRSCTWSHTFPDIWGLTNSQGYVMCSVSDINDNQQRCKDVGNLKSTYGGYDQKNMWLEDYVDRLYFSVTDNLCGLRINKPNANDTGVWKCEVNSNAIGSTSSKFWAEVDLFVANKSEVLITDPPSERNQNIMVDLSTGRASIQASCKSMYGIPLPEIIWYIDETSNRVSSRDASISTSVSSTENSVSSTISMDLDERSLGSYGVRPEHGYFSFALGCYPRQDNYFSQSRTSQNVGEVVVFGTSDGSTFPNTAPLLLATLAVYSAFN